MTITRDMVTIPPAADKMMEDGVGYIKADELNPRASRRRSRRRSSRCRNRARRSSFSICATAPGATKPEGIATANLFLNHGTITYLQGQKYPRQAFNADPSKAITNLPVVVLVNRGTAGPAEIVAAAILENARGDIVGDKTFGDGSVQKLIEMPDGSALILSIAKYYSPSGKAIQDTAVTPNVLVADTDEDAALPTTIRQWRRRRDSSRQDPAAG